MSYFDQAFAYTVGNEGGYTNDRADRGGPTNWGITIHDLSTFLGRPATIDEVQNMSIDIAKSIYLHRYWMAMGLDHIKYQPVAMCMFDIGVVRGIGVPPIYAQQICNDNGSKLAVDGHIGPLSVVEINSQNPATFVRAFALKTKNGFLGIVARNPTQVVFIRGWLRRANRLLTLLS
jgi:lysozyme family protein